MPVPLLATKLYIPSHPHECLVLRPRLVERLDEGLRLGRKLTLISAPAGYGKTTLLSEWTSSRVQSKQHRAGGELEGQDGASLPPRAAPVRPTLAFSWLSLDEDDNDLPRFFTYLVAALQQIDEHVGTGVRAALQALQPQSQGEAAWAASMIAELINDVARLSRDGPYVLVLDDYHTITETVIHEAVGLLLERQPPHLHLAIVTRQDPPLSLSRLRGRGQVTEIRQRDLRFTPDEVAAFLNQSMGLNLAASDVVALEARTEGWIAGLQLAALSMRGRDDRSVARFIQGFSGRYTFVLDYLTDEVLQRQPEPVQRFLLQTSILERMCGPLCDVVTGDREMGESAGYGPRRAAERDRSFADAQATLEYLQRANLFVVPLDDERRWYRYHRLFGELLRARLQESTPSIPPGEGEVVSSLPMGRTRELHRRAATWYDQNELPADAVHHALASQDYDLAADVIERAVTKAGTWSRVDVAMFVRWFNALPQDVARTKPWLQLFISRVFYVTGQQEATERVLQYLTGYLRDNPAMPDAERILDLVVADRASYAAVRGDVHQAISLARQILARLPAEDAAMRVRMASILALAHFRVGDMDEAGRVFSEAIAGATAMGISYAAVPLVCNLADVHFVQGRLRQAADICEQAMQMGTVDGKLISVTGYADIELGKILYEQNDLQGAERHVSEGLERLARGGTPDSFGNGYAMLARARQALGDDRAALAAVQHALQLAQGSGISRVIHLMSAYQARIWLAQGQPGQAVRWADEYRQVGPTEYLREVEDLTLARVLLARKASAEALALLDGLLSPAEDAGRLGRVIEIQALRALALRTQGDEDAALDALARALALAEPEGYVRVFLDEGEPMAELLAAVGREYPTKLLAAFGALPLHAAPDHSERATRQPAALLEPLTDRELEILYLLAEGLTNPEIARRLVISLPTVKTHTRNIYGKLDVHSRKQAVARARALGILPSLNDG